MESNWDRYEILVLSELKNLRESHEKLVETVGQLRIDVSALKVKAAWWGSVAGAGLAGIVSLVLRSLKL